MKDEGGDSTAELLGMKYEFFSFFCKFSLRLLMRDGGEREGGGWVVEVMTQP